MSDSVVRSRRAHAQDLARYAVPTFRDLRAVLAAAVVLGGCSGCFTGLCGNEIVAVRPSPDGERKPVLLRRDCGATTDFSLQPWVGPASTTIDNSTTGNALVSDRGHADVPLAATVTWTSNDTLNVGYDRRARVFKQEGRIKGVAITYPVPPNECANEVLDVRRSPDGTRKAALIRHECGDATNVSFQVWVGAAEATIDDSTAGNVLVIDRAHHQDVPLVVKLSWPGADTVSVDFNHRARVLKQERAANGVTITYPE